MSTIIDPGVANPYLTGNFGPVTEELTSFDLPVRGELPAELSGRFLRNGPNPRGETDAATYHWFTGDGMVHGIRLRDGQAEWYRNRWVRSPDMAARFDETPPPNPYGPDVGTFSANTNVIGFGGRTYAVVEAGSPPIELSDELETVGLTDFGGTLEHTFSAHPKLDPFTGELHVAAYYWAWGNKIRYLVVGPDGRVTRNVDVDVPGGPMVHDIAMSASRVALFDLPCLFDLDTAMGGARLPYRWNTGYQARIGIVSRDHGADDVQWFDIDPCYVFHPLNSYDRADGAMVIDAVRHPRMFDTQLLGPDEGATTLTRWVLDPVTGRATEDVLDDTPCEFPRMDERIQGREHRYGYAVRADGQIAHGPTIKFDVTGATTQVHDHGAGRGGMEPLFVPRGGSTVEDDGWILQLVYDAGTDGTDLVVYDAREFTADPVAVVSLPQRVPYGFHGNWVPDA